MTVETLRVLCADDVRRCCIDHQWYDRGTNDDYSIMLAYVNRNSPFMHLIPHLKFVAENIVFHTSGTLTPEWVMRTLLDYFKVSLYLYKDEDD